MTDEQKLFEAKWHLKRVRIKDSSLYHKMNPNHPLEGWTVTAALLKWENETTIFAYIHDSYKLPENPKWITNYTSQEQVEETFEIVE